MTTAHRPHALAAVCAVLLCGCAALPPPGAPASPQEIVIDVGDDVPPSPQLAEFEQRERERAQAAARRGRLAEAALSWEVLSLLRPESSEYRERLAESREQIDAAVAERAPRASQAFRRGDLDVAAQHYLALLALQPDHAGAADALRGIERERNRRNHLGRHARTTTTRRAIAEAQAAPSPPPAATVRAAPQAAAVHTDRNDLEHASILADQGELDDAIALLDRWIAAEQRDADARALLADLYFQKAESVAAKDPAAAIAALERCVRLDAAHARARQMLRQLKMAAATPARVAR